MEYNIHPIFVHFPIALLFLYSVVKIVPSHRWFPGISWRQIENTFLILGVLGAFMALSTGEIAERIVRPDRPLVEMHSFFANTTTFLYVLLLIGEALPFLIASIELRLNLPTVVRFFVSIQKLLTQPTFSKILALLGLVALVMTGLLGGAIVYGTSADPVTGVILNLLLDVRQ